MRFFLIAVILLVALISAGLLSGSCTFRTDTPNHHPTPADEAKPSELQQTKPDDSGENAGITRFNASPGLLHWDQIAGFIKQHNFFYSGKNDTGDFVNAFEVHQAVVIDHASGLMWQKTGSEASLTHRQAVRYIQDLNHDRYQGYTDWRLPSLEELCSLLENQKSNGLYISPVFGIRQQYCLSDNKNNSGYYWGVLFVVGQVYCFQEDFFVRAVRTMP